MSSHAMENLIADVQLRDGRCIACDLTEKNCMGQTDAAHVVPQRVLRAHFEVGHPAFSDLRNVLAMCRRHHNQFDAGALDLPDELLPEGFDAFCSEHGFETNERYWYSA